MTHTSPDPFAPGSDPCPELSAEQWEQGLADDLSRQEAITLGDELRNRCLRRLSWAWTTINWAHLDGVLTPPSIQLHRGERRWGSWHPDRRLITISERQVLCYSWASVLETLKHEMAHQWVSEARQLRTLPPRAPEPPHGPLFQAACQRLGCSPAASGSGGRSLFRPGGTGPDESAEDARLRRIQKLLALADRNPDEHEARAAFARARELMLRMNLESVSAPRGYAWRHLGRPLARIPHHHYLIAGILQDFYFVNCIWIHSYDLLEDREGNLLEIMGTPENLNMAEYVYECLHRQCESLYEAWKRERERVERQDRRAYLDGLLEGFRVQLARSSRESAQHGLVWVGDPGLESWTRERYPRVRNSRIGHASGGEARQDGVRAGEQLRLHRPVGGPARDRGRLLPG